MLFVSLSLVVFSIGLQDDTIRYRATLRGKALEQKMSSVGYDLLTGGEKVERVKLLNKPEPPVEN